MVVVVVVVVAATVMIPWITQNTFGLMQSHPNVSFRVRTHTYKQYPMFCISTPTSLVDHRKWKGKKLHALYRK
jgi:hypothetical protein